jgi:hypothetical protein
MLENRKANGDDINGMREEHSKTVKNIEIFEAKMQQTLNDTKFWLQNYANSHREAESKMESIRSELMGRMSALEFQLKRKISVSDMEKNFVALNDMLFIKFQRVEELQQSVRDMLVFQKYFYPLQMQTMIAENLQMSALASKDLEYAKWQQGKYENILESIEKAKKFAHESTDLEMDSHIKRLEKHHLKVSEWQIEPLENAEHDFVNDLLTRYVLDLKERV